MRKFVPRLLFLVVAAAIAVGWAPSVHAELLSNLILSGGSIQIGDKLFDDFTYENTGNMPAPTSINVIGTTDQAGNFGLIFQGPFVTAPGTSSTAAIGFQVTALGPQALIAGAVLAGNPAVIGGHGSMSVTESFSPPNDGTTLNIFDNVPGAKQLVDSALFGQPVKSLFVEKQIVATSPLDGGGLPTLSFVTQTFPQVFIPEPSTWALAIMAGFGLLLMGRRKRILRAPRGRIY